MGFLSGIGNLTLYFIVGFIFMKCIDGFSYVRYCLFFFWMIFHTQDAKVKFAQQHFYL